MSHTPGPWFAYQNTIDAWGVETRRDRDDESWTSTGLGAAIVHGIGDDTERRTRGNEEANARLIAAAPELLEALEKLHERYVMAIGNEGPEALAARAAIAKARGTS